MVNNESEKQWPAQDGWYWFIQFGHAPVPVEVIGDWLWKGDEKLHKEIVMTKQVQFFFISHP